LGSGGHETIYRLISVDKAEGGSLYQQLRCQKKRKKHYVRGREHRGQIVDRRPTSERLNHIEGPTQIGHQEGDTVIRVAHWQAIVTLVERKSACALIAKVNNKTSELVSRAIYNKLEGIAPFVKTLTFDTGKEFAEHARIDQSLKLTAYFVELFASWQRGFNMNFNDLLYQYIPKERPLSTLTDKELGMTESKLNNRPRKRLEFKTPYEVFMQPLNRAVPRV